MSVTNKTISCIGCNQPYNDSVYQPQVLDCGHGTCKSCVTQMVAQAKACPQCNHEVKAPIPNFELIDQMQAFSKTVVAQTKQYQEEEKAKDEELAKSGTKLAGLKQQMVANKDKIVAGTASELVAKAQELVTLGLFDDIEQAKSELIGKMNVPAQPQPTAPPDELTKADYQTLQQLVDMRQNFTSMLKEVEESLDSAKKSLVKERKVLGSEATDRHAATGLYLMKEQLAAKRVIGDSTHRTKADSEFNDAVRMIKELIGLIDENEKSVEDDIASRRKIKDVLFNVDMKYDEVLKRISPKISDKEILETITRAGKRNIFAETLDGQLKFYQLPSLAKFLGIPDVDTKISCVICAEPYTEAGAHQPYVFDCGHGACGSCIAQIQKNSGACHVCRAEIKAPRPNHVLIEQIAQAADNMIELAIAHKEAMEPKEEALSKAKTQASVINEKLKKYAPSSSSSSSSTSTTSTSVVNTFDVDSDFDSDEEEIDLSALPPVPTLPMTASSISTTSSASNVRVDSEDSDDDVAGSIAGMMAMLGRLNNS